MTQGKELYGRCISLAISRFKAKFQDKALILNYHRINSYDEHDFFKLNVFPKNFEEHLQVLKKIYYPLSLNQLVKALQRKKVPKKSVVITFDDGYADNLHHAKPLLEQYDFPATVFVVSKHIRTGHEFWWDTLTRIFLQPKNLPSQLSLDIDKRHYKWDVYDSNINLDYNAVRKQIHKLRNKNILSRHQILFIIHSLLRGLREEERNKVIDILFQWVGTEASRGQIYFPLNIDELNALGKNRLFEIGSHTDSHPVLSSLSEYEQYEEIKKGKTQLEDMLNCPVSSFAYPYGQLEDFTLKTTSFVRDTGFSCACSLVAGAVTSDALQFQLPRIAVPNWKAEEFEKNIISFYK